MAKERLTVSSRYWVGLSLWLAGLGLMLVPISMRVLTAGAGLLVQLLGAGLIVGEVVRSRRGSGRSVSVVVYVLLAVVVAAIAAGLVLARC